MLETSNKNYNLEINKLRKELDFFKKACRMYEKQLDLTNIQYTEENISLLNELDSYNDKLEENSVSTEINSKDDNADGFNYNSNSDSKTKINQISSHPKRRPVSANRRTL